MRLRLAQTRLGSPSQMRWPTISERTQPGTGAQSITVLSILSCAYFSYSLHDATQMTSYGDWHSKTMSKSSLVSDLVFDDITLLTGQKLSRDAMHDS